ncbi:nitrogen regulatory protein P-II family [Marinospirillum celere]|uniref:Nitrogen regulatory protein P-II family n=1 Tax=Marinospirillum celere TaxID=1122252 RepID=A0A1I1HB29_9GAMM|nr:P-II family nitrogen regulator [Marinospirillum celere]SFC21164.1 nitrogen regulatory protein P-II family [Marinospirillum celere]
MDFKLIMAFVDEGKTDSVLTASRNAGATGSTIIPNARGQGLEKSLGIFGLEILHPRDVVLVLVEARRADEVLEAIKQAGQLDESLGTGIALEIDVNKAVGLSEHIKKLEEKIPPASS